MPKKCKFVDCTKETVYTVFQVRKDEKPREQWIKAICIAYPNLVFRKNLLLIELNIILFKSLHKIL